MSGTLRLRALLVGVPLLVGICFISVYADMVSKAVQFGVLQLAPPAVAVLFGIALLNRLLTRVLRRAILSPADILVIYAMLLVGVMVSTRGVIEKLIPALAYLPYYAKPENGLNETITRHLPAWAFPFTPSAALQLPESIRRYHEGIRPGETIPWGIWVRPLAAWFVLIAAALWVFACLSTILRRQWMDNERISFPLTTLPLAIIGGEVEGQSFFRNKLMWLGFALSSGVFLLNGLNVNFPNVPRLVTDLNVNQFLTTRPWSEIDYTTIYVSLAAVGFAYFLPTDLVFSLWFFFAVTRLEDVIAVTLGGTPTAIGTHNARIWTGYQALGAYLVLIIAQVRFAWPYLRRVWETAFDRSKPPLDDSGELMSYRSALLGLFAGFAVIVGWLTLAGMSPLLATVQMGLYLFFIAVIMARAVCEAGLLMTETSFLPSHLISLVTPLGPLGAQNLSILALTNIVFARDLRGVLLSPLLDNQKMAGELRVRQRSLLAPLVLAVVLAFVVAAFFFLYFHYTEGGINLYGYPRANAQNMFNTAQSIIRRDQPPPDATAYVGLAVGVAVTLVLVYLRATLAWFPFHPLGYALAPTWTMIVFWFPFFLAWLIKSAVLRWGGMRLFRSLSPLMLGMILGEFTTAVFWAIMSTPGVGWSAPSFPWP